MSSIVSPDCRDQNHQKCPGDAWDEAHDHGTDCQCICHPVAGASRLDEIQARITDCQTYNFGMFNANKLAHDDAPKLIAALRAVEAVHRKAEYRTLIGPYCTGCTSPIDGGPELWPCSTLTAIREAMG